MIKWGFTAAAGEFDGKRIARDASEAGLDIFEVAIRKHRLILATHKFIARVEACDAMLPYAAVGCCVPDLDKQGLICSYCSESPYRYVVYASGVEQARHTLLQAEEEKAKGKPTHVEVRGYSCRPTLVKTEESK